MSTTETEPEAPHKDETDKSITAPELDTEKTPTLNLPDFEPAPDGGARAWLVTAGGFCIFFSCLGFSNSFGIFEQYYKTHQLRDEPLNKIAWIGSMSSFIQFSSGAIGGPLFDRYGAWVIRPAAIVYVFGIMMMSLCHEYWQLMLVQGILMGTAMGFLQFPVFGVVAHYFDKKRAAAMGIVVAGSSFGGVVIPIALSKMMNGSSLGFGWTVRIIGFVIMPLMIFSCLAIKSRLPPRKSSFFIGTAFKEPVFVLLITSMFFMFLGMFTPLFFVPTYAVTRGMDPTLASYLLAIINAASTFGRIIPGVLADKYGRLNIFTFAGISTGIVILCMTKAETTAALIVYSIIFGFCSGAIISGASASFSLCLKDARNMGTYLGMGMAISSLAALIGPPVNGALVDKYGGFIQVSIFSGIMCLVGGGTAIAIKAVTPQGIFGKV